jgi:hypothetical protein
LVNDPPLQIIRDLGTVIVFLQSGFVFFSFVSYISSLLFQAYAAPLVLLWPLVGGQLPAVGGQRSASAAAMSSDSQGGTQAALLLKKQLAELNKNPVEGFSAGLIDDSDLFKWEVSSFEQLEFF